MDVIRKVEQVSFFFFPTLDIYFSEFSMEEINMKEIGSPKGTTSRTVFTISQSPDFYLPQPLPDMQMTQQHN